jgi:hypothetical protein
VIKDTTCLIHVNPTAQMLPPKVGFQVPHRNLASIHNKTHIETNNK